MIGLRGHDNRIPQFDSITAAPDSNIQDYQQHINLVL
jgi:hypothetical protein